MKNKFELEFDVSIRQRPKIVIEFEGDENDLDSILDIVESENPATLEEYTDSLEELCALRGFKVLARNESNEESEVRCEEIGELA